MVGKRAGSGILVFAATMQKDRGYLFFRPRKMSQILYVYTATMKYKPFFGSNPAVAGP